MQAEQLKLRVTNDVDEIKSVLCHPEIYPVISCDGSPDSENYIPDDGPIYLLGEIEETGKIIGLFIVHQNGGHDYWCHFQVLPEYRKIWAFLFGEKAINWAFSNIPNCKKLVAQIPEIYPNVIKFAVKMGFKLEGENRQSYYKDCACFDQFYMGRLPWDS